MEAKPTPEQVREWIRSAQLTGDDKRPVVQIVAELAAAWGAAQAQQTKVEQAVNRFLGWKLPQNFSPDAFIGFDSLSALTHNSWPIGTNLLTAEQAKSMFEYCLGVTK